jgi:hypothetical protein
MPDLSLFTSQGRNNFRCHLVLQRPGIIPLIVIALGPHMLASVRVNELGNYADLITCLAHATFEHIFHVQVPRDLSDIDGFPLVSESRVASDNGQVRKS